MGHRREVRWIRDDAGVRSSDDVEERVPERVEDIRERIGRENSALAARFKLNLVAIVDDL